MNKNQLPHPPRQQTLEFTGNQIGPHLTRAVYREVQALLVQMLVEVIGRESENDKEGGEYERQDP